MARAGRRRRIIVVGTGAAGLAASIDLARAGHAVTAIDALDGPGGKMRQLTVDGVGVDAGPTVFTMAWVFERLFADAGAVFAERVELARAGLLARHAWTAGGRLDLHADIDASASAIAEFASPADAQGYRRFCADSADIFATLKDTFIAAPRPSMPALVHRVGLRRIDSLWRTRPFSTLWGALGSYFKDPRLTQLFARYATYCGSSPFAAPATLMLVAHVEQAGVWSVAKGMHALARSMAALGAEHGAQFRYGARATELTTVRGRINGVRLATGETLPADSVVFNGDVNALASGLLGPEATSAVRGTPVAHRSLSAVVWCVHGATSGQPLAHHNVFFADDYRSEFEAIFRERGITASPTVYVCAQDRAGAATDADAGRRPAPERLLVLVNAPADGDSHPMDADRVEAVGERAWQVLRDCGLHIERCADKTAVTSPAGFEQLFPGTGGALYGRANHGPLGSFARPSAVSRLPGLYLAGGSVHPGPGVPMAVLSGRLAAARLIADAQRES